MSNLPVRASVKTTECLINQKSKRSKHKEGYFASYYLKHKQKYLLAQQKYRLKLKSNQPSKPPSHFQQTKQKQLLKLLVNNRSFVPVPTKLKHPVIKN